MPLSLRTKNPGKSFCQTAQSAFLKNKKTKRLDLLLWNTLVVNPPLPNAERYEKIVIYCSLVYVYGKLKLKLVNNLG